MAFTVALLLLVTHLTGCAMRGPQWLAVAARLRWPLLSPTNLHSRAHHSIKHISCLLTALSNLSNSLPDFCAPSFPSGINRALRSSMGRHGRLTDDPDDMSEIGEDQNIFELHITEATLSVSRPACQGLRRGSTGGTLLKQGLPLKGYPPLGGNTKNYLLRRQALHYAFPTCVRVCVCVCFSSSHPCRCAS